MRSGHRNVIQNVDLGFEIFFQKYVEICVNPKKSIVNNSNFDAKKMMALNW